MTTQTFVDIPGTDTVADGRPKFVSNEATLRAQFEGTAFPSSPVLGQPCYRTDLGILYVCSNATGPVWSVVNASVFLAKAGGTLTGAINESEGSAIASGSTIDLDAATGNMVHITGTTTITAMTLAQGARRVLVFDGALSVTLSASLLGPPTNNTGFIAMAAGDTLTVIGEGSSVTRIINVGRINGAAVADTRYVRSDGTVAVTASLITSQGRTMRPASGTHADSGKVSWGTSAPGTLQEGEVYFKHA